MANVKNAKLENSTIKPMGRPGLYTPELGDEICRRLAEGESLNSICKTEGFPAESTVRSWIVDVKHPLTASYTRARELGYLKMADELLDIADDSTNDYMDRVGKDGEVTRVLDQEAMARSRLRLDTRKWMLSKMLPKVYGERLELAGKVQTGPATLSDAELEMIAARAKEK